MGNATLLAIAGMGVTALMLLLRRLNRSAPPADPDGVAVFRGDETTCRDCVDLLADAGVAAWTESDVDGLAVHVDREHAEAVPELLRARKHTSRQHLRVPTPHLGFCVIARHLSLSNLGP